MKPIRKQLCLFLTLLLALTLPGGPGASAANSSASPTPKPPPKPLGEISLYSEAAILMDGDTGQILVGRDIDKSMFPASITKILTALVALENGELSDTVVVSQVCVDAIPADTSRVVMDVGEEFTLEQLLYGLLLPSGNDAAYAIAEHVGGTYERFIEMLNEKAAALGAVNTHFTNPHGLPDPAHVTTARDMALILCAAIKDPVFLQISGTGQYVIPPTNKQPEERRINNTHRMIKPQPPNNFLYEDVIAGKTGYTVASGHTLVTAARRDGHTLVAVVLQSPDTADKFTDTTKLFDYGFDEFVPITVLGSDFPMQRVSVSLSDSSLWQAGVTAAGSLPLWVHKSVTLENMTLQFTLSPDIWDGDDTPVQVILSSTANDAMYPELGQLFGAVQLIENLSPAPSAENSEQPQEASAANADAAAPDEEDEDEGLSFWIVLRNILIGIVIAVALLFAVLLIMRAQNIRRYRRRRRRNRIR